MEGGWTRGGDKTDSDEGNWEKKGEKMGMGNEVDNDEWGGKYEEKEEEREANR